MGDRNGAKDECNINMRDGTITKDVYNNDIENGASKYNKYRINIILIRIHTYYLII